MEVCETCGQSLPNQAPDTHGTKVGLDQAPDPGGDLEEHSIEFETFESPLQRIKEKNGFLTIKTDSEQRTKISCALVRQRVDDAVDMTKYSIYADMDNCKILLTGIEDDVPTFIISFKTSMAFDKCLKALRPFRPHLNSCVQHNRPIPSNNPRRVGETRTVTPKTLRKLDDGQFQPELATLNEVEIHSIDKWRDEYTQILKRASDEGSGSQSHEQIYQLRGQSDEERSSSGSEIDMAAVSLEDVDQTILRGRLAKDKRYKKTVSLTSDQYDALQVKKLLNYDKPIITRGGTFDHVTLLEGDEIMTVNGQRSQTIHPECYSLERNSPSETVTITVRSCTRSISASNIPNNVKGLGITWNNTVVESVGTGPLIQDSVFAPLGQDTFCLTHVNGGFIPFYTGREKIYQLLQKAGERVDLVFQPEKRMKAIAEL